MGRIITKIPCATAVYPSVYKVKLGGRDIARTIQRVRTSGSGKSRLDIGNCCTSGAVGGRTLSPQIYHIRHRDARGNRRSIWQIRSNQRRARDKSTAIRKSSIRFSEYNIGTNNDRTWIRTIWIITGWRCQTIGSRCWAIGKINWNVSRPLVVRDERVKQAPEFLYCRRSA